MREEEDGPQESRLIEKDYRRGAESARELARPLSEKISLIERKEIIGRVVDKVFTGEGGDEALPSVVGDMIRLIRTFPLEEQQIGIVVRAQRIFGEQEIKETRRKLIDLTTNELLTLQAGDWEETQQIFNLFPERERAWEQALKGVVTGNFPLTVYRGMWLNKEDIPIIMKYGIVPEGLRKFIGVGEAIATQIKWWYGCERRYSKEEHSAAQKRKLSLLEDLPLSPINILHEVYFAGEFGTSSCYKLGISTTTPQNLRSYRGRFFGNYLLRLSLPANRLIRSKNIGDSEDEHTVLYYIPPERITGCCFVPKHHFSPLTELLPPPHN